MPKIYKHNCNYCHSYYEGRGSIFCSRKCADLFGRSKESNIKRSKTLSGRKAWNTGIPSTVQANQKRHLWNVSVGNYGRYKQNGYWYIKMPEHPFCNSNGYILEHHYMAEVCLGRFLNPEEEIHHIDSNRENNLPENLYLFANTAEHRRHENNFTHTNIFIKSNLI